MSSLSKEEKDLILDFYFRCGDEDKIDDGRDLVAANPNAAFLYAQLEDTLTQLDHDKYEPCPENLVELTVARLKLAASSGHTQLHKLLELEQQKPDEETPNIHAVWGFRENLTKIAAMAAMLLIAATIAVPTMSNMRQKSWQTACANRLKNIGIGIAGYAGDNDGQLPYLSSSAGNLWSKVGDQGIANQSNTRPPFQMLKGQYISAQDFICPGNKLGIPLNRSAQEIAELNDFPSRNNFNFSFRIMCEKSSKRLGDKTYILMSDVNPIFEGPGLADRNGVQVSEKLIRLMSRNHKCKGQNLLFSDGNVKYVTVRIVDGDDIFTIKDVRAYEGRETPCDDSDTFLAP